MLEGSQMVFVRLFLILSIYTKSHIAISSSLSSRARSSLIEEASAAATALLNRRRSRLIKPLSYQLRKHNISYTVSPLRHLRLGLRILPAILNTHSGSSLIAGVLYISRPICAN
jgi:hypothetical protein